MGLKFRQRIYFSGILGLELLHLNYQTFQVMTFRVIQIYRVIRALSKSI